MSEIPKIFSSITKKLKFIQAIFILGKKIFLCRTDLIKLVKYFRLESPLRFISPQNTVHPPTIRSPTSKCMISWIIFTYIIRHHSFRKNRKFLVHALFDVHALFRVWNWKLTKICQFYVDIDFFSSWVYYKEFESTYQKTACLSHQY